ncbi:PREDICTED: TMV resistance, partial [Prunus dulcis]
MALSTQRASTSRTSAEWAPPPHWKHDVFLSFRGEDTRSGFLAHLYHELQYWQAIKTFKDDRDLEIGATISPELLTAIEQSHLAIIVLSPNYASSTWCLDELSKILECMQDRQRILPIFYHVDPSDVRNQRGSFAEAFTKHEEKFRVVNWWRATLRKVANLFGWDSKHEEFSGDVEMVKRWRAALTKIANISGWDSKNYPSEAELIKRIVNCVFRKVHPTFMLSGSLDKLVGIDSALEQLHLHLAPKDNDVRFIGIWGMGGVGKTTLAKLVSQRISHHFELSWFLSNVREVSGKQGDLVNLQRQILSPILKENVAQCVWDEGAGTFFTKKHLCNKKVLLILDDVHQLNQLKTLAGKKDWFGVGSRIIITTRDERLLVEHGIAIRYKVEVLKDDEALELFSQNAFKKNQPEEGFLELSRCFVHYAKGLPLALTTLGSFLYARDQDKWKSVFDNLRKICNPTIFHSLRVSYDGQEEIDKKIFLDVACFHTGKDEEQVIEILDSIYNISSRIRIDILIEKSLLIIEKFHDHKSVQMHDLIQEMAWEIVHLQSQGDPCQRSRLWLRNDISHVFTNSSGTRAIEAIVLRLPKLEAVPWNCTEAFNEMHGLRLLHFDNVVFSSGPKILPNSLRIIQWSWYPSKSLPSRFEPHVLSKLEMRGSKLVRLWDGAKDFPKLKYMDLSYSDKLTSIPDFTRMPNLEELNLEGCKKL